MPKDWPEDYVAWDQPMIHHNVLIVLPEHLRSLMGWLAGRRRLDEDITIFNWCEAGAIVVAVVGI